MKIRMLAGTFVLGAACALVSNHALSQEEWTPEEMAKAMEEWMMLMKPGKQHEQLDYFVGTWDTTTNTYWGGPGSPPMTTTGESEAEWVLDGRFMLQKMKSSMHMPNESGGLEEVPYEGLGMTGFDNNRKMYVGTWASNLGTEMLTMKGGASPDGKTFTSYGEMDEPMLGVVGRYVKYITRIVDENTFKFEIIDLHAGDDYKVIEITYKRRS